jgi:hypothetical protein
MSKQTEFDAFKEAHPEYNIKSDYAAAESRRRQKNDREIDDQFSTGRFQSYLEEKLDNQRELRPLLRHYSNKELCESYQKADAGLCLLIQAFLSKPPNKQRFGETFTEKCLDKAKQKQPSMTWKRCNGDCYVHEGREYAAKPSGCITVGGVDYTIDYAGHRLLLAQKRMKRSDGTHQDNQKEELYNFAKASKNPQGFFMVIVWDGARDFRYERKILQSHDDLVICKSTDLWCLLKWVETW